MDLQDITVRWGEQPSPADMQNRRWRQAVFQDVQCSHDGARLYFLYDPFADESSGTSGGRKGGPSIVVFDSANQRCFVRELPLPNLRPNVEGVLKMLFLIDSYNGVIVTEIRNGNYIQLQFWRVAFSGDGYSLACPLTPLFGPIPIGGEEYIVTAREDAPELVLLSGPGLTVQRFDALNPSAAPLDSFSVAGGDMRLYYDAFVSRGVVYCLAARPDDSFDFSHIHTLDLLARGTMVPRPTQPDPQRGVPPARKQTGMDVVREGKIYMAGGEVELPNGDYRRFQDVWSLDLNTTFQWSLLPQQLPVPLIEPRVTASSQPGSLLVWGDIDDGALGFDGTYLRILRATVATNVGPPSAGYPPATGAFAPASSAGYPPAPGTVPGPPPPSYSFAAPQQQPPSYSAQQQFYPQAPQQQQQPPNMAAYGYAAGGSGYPQQQQQQQPYAPNAHQQQQQPYYPADQGKDKNCTIA